MKPPKPLFYGIVEKGQLAVNHPDRFKEYYQQFEGKEVQILVESKKRKRSNKQNRYYWGVVISILCDYFGYDNDEMHEALKWQFLRKKDLDPPTVGSTRKMSTVEWEDYMSKVRSWASLEYGVNIPEPNEPFYCGDDYYN